MKVYVRLSVCVWVKCETWQSEHVKGAKNVVAKDFDYEIAARTWTLCKSWPTSCCCCCWCWCLGPIGLNTQCGCVSSLTRFKSCCDPQRLRFIPYKSCCRCSCCCCCWCSLHDAIAVCCGLRSALTDRRTGSQRGKGRNGAGVFRYRFRLQMRFESTFLCE